MRLFISIFCVAALIAFTGPALASPVLETSGHLYLPMVGDRGTVTVNLTGAEGGRSGYNLTLNMVPSKTATIASVAFPPWANMPMNGIMPAENTWIQAVDLQMGAEPGDSPILLATITIQATADGETILTVVPVIVDDDQGGRYTLDPIQIPVQVGAVPTETLTQDASPTTRQASSSSSSADTTPQETPRARDTPPSPPVTQLSETTESVPTAIASLLPSPSPEISADEPTIPSTEATPGFDCITSCLAGLLICGLFLLTKIKR